MRTPRFLATVLAAMLVFSCASAPREPEPTVAGNLTARDIETVMADAMMVTAAHLFRLLADDRIGQPSGTMESDTSTFTWTGVDMNETRGAVSLLLDGHELKSDLFSEDYKGYVFTGTVEMIMRGESADLFMDLRTSHRNPERYPVTSLEARLSNLEDDIVPEHVDGYITVNGYEVPVADFVRALQIGD